MLKKTREFIHNDIWQTRLRDFPRFKRHLVKTLRIIIMSLRGYIEDRCKFRASALTFFSLLSIVPILAMVFGVAKGFGFDQAIIDYINERFAQYPQFEEDVGKVITFSRNLLERTKGGVVAGVGIVILLLAVLRLLGNIEDSFNFIWGIKKPRPLLRKIADYLLVILICPFFLVVSTSVNVYLIGKIETIISELAFLDAFQPIIFFGLQLLPLIPLWLVFSFIFSFVPNTKVNFIPTMIAGLVTAILFQLVQIIYIAFQIGVTRYNEIYGSFAALPLFLVWLQLSWFIVLFGSELAFALQNVDTFELEPQCRNASRAFKNKIAILVTSLVAKNFNEKKAPLTAPQIGNQLDLPIRLVRDLAHELTEANIFSEVNIDDGRDPGFQPARPVENLTIHDVLTAIKCKGLTGLDFAKSDEISEISDHLSKMDESAMNNPANVPVVQL